jgi:PleD family two-component response regulator
MAWSDGKLRCVRSNQFRHRRLEARMTSKHPSAADRVLYKAKANGRNCIAVNG